VKKGVRGVHRIPASSAAGADGESGAGKGVFKAAEGGYYRSAAIPWRLMETPLVGLRLTGVKSFCHKYPLFFALILQEST
jgi:hypothetical protein